jgi:DNA-directed RNA polymerase specialized sigma24 family protein
MSSPDSGSPLFARTRWSLVRRACGSTPEARAALGELCEAYWLPVFRVLRRGGREEDAAREVAQEFFAHVLSGGRLEGADPALGRFRSYLLGALRHFESDRRERERRMKRGGGILPEPLTGEEPGTGQGVPWTDHEFDREWALAVVSRAVTAVSEAYAKSGRAAQFERLKPSLLGGDLPSQAALAGELGCTEGALKVAIHRLRRSFREAVKAEISQTLPEAEDADGELRYLIEVLSRL